VAPASEPENYQGDLGVYVDDSDHDESTSDYVALRAAKKELLASCEVISGPNRFK
jgi:hypothetical protein